MQPRCKAYKICTMQSARARSFLLATLPPSALRCNRILTPTRRVGCVLEDRTNLIMMQRSAVLLAKRALRPQTGAIVSRCVGAAVSSGSPICAISQQSRSVSLGVSKKSGSPLSQILAKEIADETHAHDEESERGECCETWPRICNHSFLSG
jgi:hypothetical protein